MNYITSADITHAHLTSIMATSPTIIDPYITEANTWLEDLAIQMNVAPESIQTPVGVVVKRYLSNYVVYRFAEDSIGLNNVDISVNDMYVVMARKYFDIAEDLKRKITPELLITNTLASGSSRTISQGRLWRS